MAGRGRSCTASLGNNPITMLIQYSDDKHYTAVYFYDKHRKAIPLSGDLKNNQLEFTETNPDPEGKNYKMELKLKDGVLSGVWIGKKNYPVQLQLP
ncbi:hypothetical protein [Undibacterium sp. Di27W]|uniref:hypothetical protein n=1 Tax=Undibacterium sp. Di27W TaxID=3413036 RepID=UPI003BF4F87D